MKKGEHTSKDWVGNGRKSVFSTLGASSHSTHQRQSHDYYATEPSAIHDLFNVHNFDATIWEPACGEGHLSDAMKEYGKSVYSTDLIDRGYGEGILDFLHTKLEWPGDIITNPPYKYAKEFAEKALSLLNENKQLAMFLKLTFLEGQSRYKLFQHHPPEYVYVFSQRKKCAMNGDFANTGSSAAAYGWFVWRKGFTGNPTIRWIAPKISPNQILEEQEVLL